MATIGTLVARVEARIALANGLDVQIVDEPRILEMLRSKYNSLFDDTWWTVYMTMGTYQLDPLTGTIVGDLTGIVNRFVDIHSIFYNHLPDPLPLLKWNLNPMEARRPCYTPYPDPTKLFRVFPSDQAATVNVWFRTRLLDAQWEQDNDETEVNMDDEALILGTVYEYLSDDGSNDSAAEKYLGLYTERKRQISKLQFQAPISKTNDRMGWPTDWQVNGP